MKIKLFRDAGLNENEAETYKLLLEEGELTPPQVAESLKLSRQNSYAVLKSLEKLGLARNDRRHNKLRYVPGDPRILEGIIQNKRKKLETTEEQLADSMEELSSFYNLAKNRPGISAFHGVEGTQTLYEDALRRKPKEILMILSSAGRSSYLSAWIVRHFRPLRVKAGIHLREISDEKWNETEKELTELLWQKKLVEIKDLPNNLDVLIYDGNITFISYQKREPFGFTVDDPLVYRAIRAMFETIWNLN